jgi:hydrogenase expression/formation protein HypE
LSSEEAGKISPAIMQRIIYPNLGARRSEVIVGPAAGLDTCIVELDPELVLVASTDPLSLIPQLGVEESAWMSINLLINDLATSGMKPKYMMVDLNLPPDLSNEVLSVYWMALSKECANMEISIIGGNTGKFEGCGLTIIGSGTTFTTGPRKSVVSSTGARLGDQVIVTKGAAISTTGLLAKMFPKTVGKKLGEETQQKSAEYFSKIAGFEDAQIAVSIGGVTAMHDVAEGGVLASMQEMAEASGLGMKIFKSSIPVSAETKAISVLFGIDPYWSLGEGAMLMACDPNHSSQVIDGLTKRGIAATVAGEMIEKDKGVFVADESDLQLLRPKTDPYWRAYYSAVDNKWE